MNSLTVAFKNKLVRKLVFSLSPHLTFLPLHSTFQLTQFKSGTKSFSYNKYLLRTTSRVLIHAYMYTHTSLHQH